MTARRNYFIRSVAALVGDIAVGIAMASACTWVIEAAALGLFLSFMLWLLGVLAWLAFSQHALHPAIAILLSDRKLDQVLDASAETVHAAAVAATKLWRYMREQGMDLRPVTARA